MVEIRSVPVRVKRQKPAADDPYAVRMCKRSVEESRKRSLRKIVSKAEFYSLCFHFLDIDRSLDGAVADRLVVNSRRCVFVEVRHLATQSKIESVRIDGFIKIIPLRQRRNKDVADVESDGSQPLDICRHEQFSVVYVCGVVFIDEEIPSNPGTELVLEGRIGGDVLVVAFAEFE